MMDEQKVFYVGDEVEWTSQGGGYTKTKRGTVVDVVAPGIFVGPFYIRDRDLAGFATRRLCVGEGSRDHESYLVLVGTQLYWPRVKDLNLVEPLEVA